MRLSNTKDLIYMRLSIILKEISVNNNINEINQTSNVGEKETQIQKEINDNLDLLGKDGFNFIFKNILQEIDWIKLNLNIIKTYYSNLNIYPCYDLLSKSFIKAIDNDMFEDFIADLINCMPIYKKLSPDLCLLIAKNLFMFISVISNLDEENQLLLCLGFIFSGIEFYSHIGQENLIYLLKHYIRTIRMSFITTKTLNKVILILSGNLEKKLKEEKELNINLQKLQNQNQSLIENQISEQIIKIKNHILILKNYIKTINKEISCDKRKQNEEFQIIKINQSNSINFDKLNKCLGPLYLNNIITKENEVNSHVKEYSSNLNIINFEIDEKILSDIILFLINSNFFLEEKDHRLLQKLFFKIIDRDIYTNIDEDSDKKFNLNWNLENFIKKIKTKDLSCEKFYNYLFDNKNINILDKKSFDILLSLLNKLNFDNQFCYFLLKRSYKNIDFQINCINFLLQNLNPIIKLGNKIKKNNNYDLIINVKPSQINSFLFEIWSSIDFISGVFRLGCGENMNKVRPLFDWPIANIPEIITLSLFQLPKDNYLYWEIMQETIPLFLSNHINSSSLLEDLWNLDSKRFIEALALLHSTIPEVVTISKILDITQKVKDCLIPMVSSKFTNFSICLGILAVKRDFLHIDPWLSDQIEKKGDEFIIPLINFINNNVVQEYTKKINNLVYCQSKISQKQGITHQFSNSPEIQRKENVSSSITQLKGIPTNNYNQIKDQILEKSQLTIEALIIIFENLNFNILSKNSKVNTNTIDSVNFIYKQIFDIFDEMQCQPLNSEETEEKANLVFKKLFNEEITVKALALQMKGYKESLNKKENEVFACMIHSMLDEYRFFNKYPDKELILMGSLFGKIIEMKLIEGLIESIALKYILEGFKKGGKMIIFSYKALEQFIDKIKNWPFFLEEIYRITKNYQGQGDIYNKITERYNEYVKNNEAIGINMSSNIIGASQINYNLNSNPNISQGMNFQMYNNPIPNYMSNMNQQQIPQTNGNFQRGNFLNPHNNVINTASNSYSNIVNFSKQKNNKFNTPQEVINHQIQSQSIFNNIPNIPQSSSQTSLSISSTAFTPSVLIKQSSLVNSNQNILQPPYKKNNPLNTSFNSANNKEDGNNSNIQNSQLNNQNNQTLQNQNQNQTSSKLISDFNEKMNLIFHKLNIGNIVEKALEIKYLITNELILKYFSNYLIVKRVCNEKDRLFTYFDLINIIDIKILFLQIVKDSIIIIKRLINSEDLNKEQNQKLIFKNLGTWFGIITLNRNKPILARDINLKELIFDGFKKGRLLIYISFVTKVLEGSLKSKVFHNKNPYIQNMFNLLIEIYHNNIIVQNIKFEIEIFFKKFDVDPSKVIPKTNYTQNLIPLNSECSEKKDEEIKTLEYNNISNEDKKIQMEASVEDITKLIKKSENIIERLALSLNKFNIQSPENRENLFQIILSSLVFSINHILSTVVERTVNISLLTTKDIVIKDFAFEKDPKRFQKAAELSIKSLSGSLAIVTCKDPLKLGFLKAIKEKFSFEGIDFNNDQNKINDVLNEIIDIGCFYIQNYVISKAIEKVNLDENIKSHIDKREKGNYIISNESNISKKISLLPKNLRPSINEPNENLMEIYNDFEKLNFYQISNKN